MKLLKRFPAGFALFFGVCAWTVFAWTYVAAQTVQPNPEPQSFTVAPGTPEDEEPVVVLHNTTRRVVVDVVVTGPDGKPLRGLTQKDFQVTEDRKPQSFAALKRIPPRKIRAFCLPFPSCRAILS